MQKTKEAQTKKACDYIGNQNSKEENKRIIHHKDAGISNHNMMRIRTMELDNRIHNNQSTGMGLKGMKSNIHHSIKIFNFLSFQKKSSKSGGK